MSPRQIELVQRRERLVARIAVQRVELGVRLAPVEGVLGIADKGVAAVRWLQRHPGVVAGTVALTVAMRPRAAFTWLKRGWAAWKLVQRVRERLTGV